MHEVQLKIFNKMLDQEHNTSILLTIILNFLQNILEIKLSKKIRTLSKVVIIKTLYVILSLV